MASRAGYSRDDVRDVMLEAVEKRFGQQPPATVQWLGDNGSAYTAEQTCAFARQSARCIRSRCQERIAALEHAPL